MKKIKDIIKGYLTQTSSIWQLTIAACLGIYIAFCPFIGFHTLMTIVFSWAFSLNFFVMFGISSAINNPWTMAFVYGLDYVVGYWILKWLRIDPMSLNPQWVERFNDHIYAYTGLTGISFGAFLIGGNVLGIVFSILLYPIIYAFFKKLHKEVSSNLSKNNDILS